MSIQVQNWIQLLEAEWSKPDGFLGKAREGVFDPRQGESFVDLLEGIKLLQHGSSIDRRLVSLIWYIPMFLEWQTGRVTEKSGDGLAFRQLANRVLGIVQDILGVP